MDIVTRRNSNGLYKAFVVNCGFELIGTQRAKPKAHDALIDLQGMLAGLAQDARRKATEARNEPVVV